MGLFLAGCSGAGESRPESMDVPLGGMPGHFGPCEEGEVREEQSYSDGTWSDCGVVETPSGE